MRGEANFGRAPQLDAEGLGDASGEEDEPDSDGEESLHEGAAGR